MRQSALCKMHACHVVTCSNLYELMCVACVYTASVTARKFRCIRLKLLFVRWHAMEVVGNSTGSRGSARHMVWKSTLHA